MAKRVAIYPGTFDPITKGHLDIINRGRMLFDTLVVAVADSTPKGPLFSVDERVDLIRHEVKKHNSIKVESFDGLLVDYAREKKATVLLRGLRVISDFEYEFQMALTNRELAPDVETVFMMTAESYAHISSRFIRDIARLGGDLKSFVTPAVARALKKKNNKPKHGNPSGKAK
ncbi:Phosphopantetheine adenylyltransferase [hydrothermal vent metagenome]|uniref:Phosphopantetheine adenylyltransferase n=1 Tax=hydrothermal vent metagenome TaxID=652676 RepID=A0A3B0VT71_9ZZZZ